MVQGYFVLTESRLNKSMAIGFDINAFRAAVNEKGLLRPSKFMAYFPLPNGLLGIDDDGYLDSIGRDVNLWCESADIPSMSTQFAQVRRYGYGPLEKVPVAPLNPEVTLTFICDAKAEMWNMFYTWKQLVVATDASRGVNPTSRPFAPYSPYETGYKEDWATSLIVSTFDDAGTEVQRVIIREAGPLDVGAIKFDWNDTGRIVKFPVTFHYMDFYVDSPALTAPPTVNSPLDGFVGPQPTFNQPTNQSIVTSPTRGIS